MPLSTLNCKNQTKYEPDELRTNVSKQMEVELRTARRKMLRMMFGARRQNLSISRTVGDSCSETMSKTTEDDDPRATAAAGKANQTTAHMMTILLENMRTTDALN